MDLQQLVVTLQHCLSSNPNERQAAEQALTQHQHAKGQIVNLLRASVEDGVEETVRQVAAISFKNAIKRGWDSTEEDGQPRRFDDEDKAVVRSHLLEAIIRAPPKIKVQLGECLKSIVYSDYPEKWPDLLGGVVENMKSAEQARLHGALYALRILARKYEFKDKDERGPLGMVINNSFPMLLQIFQAILSEGSRNVEVAELIKLICKTFWSSTFMSMPACLADHDQFVGWMTCIHTFINMPVPEEGMPEDLDARMSWPWWKAKKWVLHISNRLLTRYSDPAICSVPEEQAFATMFSQECLPKFVESVLHMLAGLLHGRWLPPRSINLALHFLTSCIPRAETYKIIKPHLNELLANVVFPILCFDDTDAELWANDPHEYIRKGYDVIEEMYNPRTAAMNFLHEVCKVRPKMSLDFFMAHVARCFGAYLAAGPQPPAKEARHMDGALLSVGTLYDVLKKKKVYRSNLESMLVQHVLPAFRSPWGHLRAKACWVSGMFCGIEFKDRKNFEALLQGVFSCLQDPELPVRMDSVVSVRHFVEAMDDATTLKPVLPQLLDHFFSLMGEVENEDLVMTLECIVEKFGDEISPYAVALCQNLSAAFLKMSEQEENGDEDEDDLDSSVLAAFGCLRAITTVLESMSSMPQVYPQLEEILFPLMYKMTSTDGQEVFEEVVEIMSYFTYFSPSISPRMWALWPRLHQCLTEWAIDYFDNILVPLDNFINRDTETFLSNPEYVASVYDMASKVLTGDASETDMIPACKIMEIVLQNCRGRVDDQVGPYLDLALGRLRLAEKNSLKDFCVQVVANALYYNSRITLQHLHSRGALQYTFSTWFEMIGKPNPKSGKPMHFRRIHDKKICALGLTALLQTPTDALPPEVQSGLPQVLQGVAHLLVRLKEQMEAAEKGDDDDEGEEDEEQKEGEGEDNEQGDDEDIDDDGDEEDDKELLRKLAMKARDVRLGEDSDDEEWTDDEEVQTPIDDVDPFISFADTLTHLQSADQQRMNMLTSSVDDQVRGAVQACMQYADHQRAELAKRSQGGSNAS